MITPLQENIHHSHFLVYAFTKMYSISTWNNISSSPHLFLLLTATLCCFITYILLMRKKNNYRLPPGPPGLPIIGNLHMLGDLPHQNLCKLAKKYGPVMSIQLGLVPAVVISSPEMAELFLKTHDIVFASRPNIQAAKLITYGQKGLAFSPYGPYWRNIRKFCTLHLLSHSKIESFMSMRKEEVTRAVTYIKDLLAEQPGEVAVDMTGKIGSLVESITYRMVFGGKADQFNLKPVMDEVMRIVGNFDIGDYVPYIGALDLQGFARRMKVARNFMDDFLEKTIKEHIQDAKQQEPKHDKTDFIDVMLSLINTKEGKELDMGIPNIKAVSLDMLVAATDTTVTAVEWALSELIRNPRVMKLVQKEIERAVGLERMVEEIDLAKLEYLEMVMKEIMRLHPVAPLLVPHESMEDIKIKGYDVPKKSRMIVNFWAIGRDPNVWSDNAEEFYPERFIGSDIDLKGKDFRLIPFGSGRRGCPGMHLGLTMVRLILAQLVHCFNWELPNGMSPDDFDMTEKFGLTVPRAKRLLAVPTYRLNIKNV